jgi:tryptophanyl-tRNA synthetase
MFLNMNAYKGELERVSSFKEKARTQPDNVNAGLLTYPVLMAADILIHRGTGVPVGKDQEQHLEMARTFANRFNRLYQTEVFREPYAIGTGDKLIKVPGLTGGGKMSKSAGEADNIYLDDEPEVLRKKIMRAVSDSGPTEPGAAKSQAVQNLFVLMDLVCKPEVIAHFEETHQNGSIRYGDLKKQLAEDMEYFIAPLREKIKATLANPDLIRKAAKIGIEKARVSAEQTMRQVHQAIGIGGL